MVNERLMKYSSYLDGFKVTLPNHNLKKDPTFQNEYISNALESNTLICFLFVVVVVRPTLQSSFENAKNVSVRFDEHMH